MAAATAIALGGLAISAATTTASFIQANKQKNLQKQAEKDAAQAMVDARKLTDINFFDQLAINKEPYELQREALLSQGAEAIQAGQEQERGAAATAGRIQMAMNEQQAGIRTSMGKEMSDLEKMQASEDSRLRDINAQLYLSEAEGAQQAAADAQRQAAAATSQGWQGVQNTLQQGLQMLPLYFPDKEKSTTDATNNAPTTSEGGGTGAGGYRTKIDAHGNKVAYRVDAFGNKLPDFGAKPVKLDALGNPIHEADFGANPSYANSSLSNSPIFNLKGKQGVDAFGNALPNFGAYGNNLFNPFGNY